MATRESVAGKKHSVSARRQSRLAVSLHEGRRLRWKADVNKLQRAISSVLPDTRLNCKPRKEENSKVPLIFSTYYRETKHILPWDSTCNCTKFLLEVRRILQKGWYELSAEMENFSDFSK